MATTTPNYSLRKPATNDYVNVQADLNENWDKVDAHAHSGTYVPVGGGDITGRVTVTPGASDSDVALRLKARDDGAVSVLVQTDSADRQTTLNLYPPSLKDRAKISLWESPQGTVGNLRPLSIECHGTNDHYHQLQAESLQHVTIYVLDSDDEYRHALEWLWGSQWDNYATFYSKVLITGAPKGDAGGGADALQLLSQSATAKTEMSLGRTVSDVRIGVAGAANDYFSGTASGSTVIQSQTGGGIHIGASSSSIPALFVSANNVGVRMGTFGGGQGVLGIQNAVTAPTTDPTEAGGLLYSVSGQLVWRNSSGHIRNVTSNPDLLASGESTIPRRQVSATSVTTGTGSLRLTYFTAEKTETINSLRLFSGGTAAAATPTLVRAGVYSVAANGDLTLVASIANDTALFAGTNTAYTRALSAPLSKVAGQRYAVGVLVVTGATAPTVVGQNALNADEAAQAPRLGGLVTGQTDLPASVANGSVGNTGNLHYSVLVP